MRFYQSKHRHYCGIDLHARTMHVCVVDAEGRKLLHQNVPASRKALVECVAPFRDDLVDNLNRECFHLALEIGDDADRREWAMTMLLTARAIERIADNAVDIGEQVAFVVTGLFREFEDASHPTP